MRAMIKDAKGKIVKVWVAKTKRGFTKKWYFVKYEELIQT